MFQIGLNDINTILPSVDYSVPLKNSYLPKNITYFKAEKLLIKRRPNLKLLCNPFIITIQIISPQFDCSTVQELYSSRFLSLVTISLLAPLLRYRGEKWRGIQISQSHSPKLQLIKKTNIYVNTSIGNFKASHVENYL